MATPPGRPRLLLLALAAAAAVLLLSACTTEPVAERDKELFLRASDFVEYGVELRDVARFESFKKTRYFDGSFDLEYTYEVPEEAAAQQADPLYLMVTVTVEKNQRDAAISHGAEKVGLGLGLRIEGLKMEEKKEFFRYGDESAFYVLTKDGNPVGNYFVTRAGTKLYSVLIAGVYFDDPQTWAGLVSPKLEKFSAYAP